MPSTSHIRRWAIAAGLLLTLPLTAGVAGAEAKPRALSFISDAGDRLAASTAESSTSGALPNSGTGTTSRRRAGAGDATFATPAGGGSELETVIAPDRRVPITSTTAYPARPTVHITFQKVSGGSTFQCTGFLVGPNTVATAGHCVHHGSSSGFFVRSSFKLYPGRNGSTIPYTCPGGVTVGANALWTNSSWAGGGGETVDYGAIRTTCPIGDTVGWYGYLNTAGASQTGLANYTQGYPGDKAFGTQWSANNCASDWTSFVQCTIAGTETRQLFYKNDTFGGQSGSPVYRTPSTCSPCAVAIHAYGLHGSGLHSSNNHGTRIENNVTSFLNSVKSS